MTFSKGSKQPARGAYDAAHKATRARLLPQAYGKPCARCGLPMEQGQDLHLDHNDERTGYLGFSHAVCNVRAGARRGAAVVNAKRRGQAGGDAVRVVCAPPHRDCWHSRQWGPNDWTHNPDGRPRLTLEDLS